MTYIYLNMVRAGAVQHPDGWDVTAYGAIQRPWKRKDVIDFDALCDLLEIASTDQLARRMRRAAKAGIGSTGQTLAGRNRWG